LRPISFTFEGETVELDPDALTSIGEKLLPELTSVSRDFVRVGRYLAHMNAVREKTKTDYEAKRGRRYAELKSGAFETLYLRKPTEDALVHCLNEDPSIMKARDVNIEAARVAEELYALRTGLQMKLDVLREISMHVRLDVKNHQQGNNSGPSPITG
jgi:hypothetical protein